MFYLTGCLKVGVLVFLAVVTEGKKLTPSFSLVLIIFEFVLSLKVFFLCCVVFILSSTSGTIFRNYLQDLSYGTVLTLLWRPDRC